MSALNWCLIIGVVCLLSSMFLTWTDRRRTRRRTREFTDRYYELMLESYDRQPYD